MATAKAEVTVPTTTKRKRRKSPVAKKKTRKRRKVKKTYLGEMLSPAVATGAFKDTVSGAFGGGIGYLLEKHLIPDNTHVGMKSAILAGAGFLLASIGKMPKMGAGVSAIAGYTLIEHLSETGLSDSNDYLQEIEYADPIEELPPMLDSEGQPMYLDESNSEYLQEGEGYDLAERRKSVYQVPYAPNFSGTY